MNEQSRSEWQRRPTADCLRCFLRLRLYSTASGKRKHQHIHDGGNNFSFSMYSFFCGDRMPNSEARSRERYKHQEAADTNSSAKHNSPMRRNNNTQSSIEIPEAQLHTHSTHSMDVQSFTWLRLCLLIVCLSSILFSINVFFSVSLPLFSCAYVLNFNFSRLSFAHRRNYSMCVCEFAKCSVLFCQRTTLKRKEIAELQLFFFSLSSSSTGFSYTK